GAVLYEMLTGQRAFEGKSQLSVASAILEREPAPICSSKPMTPPPLDHAIRRCLAKDPEGRWQTARDLHSELVWVGESAPMVTAPRVLGGSQSKRELFAWLAVGVFALAAVAAFWFRSQPPVEHRRLQFTINPPPGTDFLLESGGGNAISPDGHTVAF